MIEVLAFLLAILILVSIHEWGHYAVGRLFDVKVKDFSIGFGAAFFQRRSGPDQTTFSLRWIPLGGFVRFLDSREGAVEADEVHRAFDHKPVYQRFLIVLAGPLINLLLAWFLFLVLFTQTVQQPKAFVGEVLADSPAALLDIEAGSRVIRFEDQDVLSWNDFVLALTRSTLSQERAVLTWLTPSRELRSAELDLSDPRLSEEASLQSHLGFSLYQPVLPARLGSLQAGGAAQGAGLRTGDVIVSLSGVPIASWQSLVAEIQKRPNQRVELVVQREGEAFSVSLSLGARQTPQGEQGFMGASVDTLSLASDYFVERDYGLVQASEMAWQRLQDVTSLTLRALWRMLTGSLSLDNLSGPVSIATHAGASAQMGWMTFVGFLAFLSVSLGVLNLLPIPMLDGGHLVYFSWEALTGKPVSEQWQYNAQKFGFVLLMVLTGLALYNDLMRISL
jgi:regulator of sigma E protease